MRPQLASPFKSQAEQIAAFEGRVPPPSRKTRPADVVGGGGGAGDGSRTAHKQLHGQQQQHGGMAALTVPHSPRFATRQRVRPPRFKPREEVEAEQMAAMPKFKARPVK